LHDAVATDAKIYDVAVAFIRRAVADRTDWSFTAIGALHASIAGRLSLAGGELVTASGFYSSESWYVFTTRRVVSQFEGVIQSLDPSQGLSYDFGNFKGYGPDREDGDLPDVAVVTREVATITAKSGAVVRFEFATWEESTAPIAAARYWDVKHPFIDKLMTTAEREHYKRYVAVPRTPKGRPVRPLKGRAQEIIEFHAHGVIPTSEMWGRFSNLATPDTLPAFMAEVTPEMRDYFRSAFLQNPDVCRTDQDRALFEALSRCF
jgi:hypothetical protein